MVVVHGAAGIGKTTLALHTAHRVKKNYPDARLYIDLRGDGDSPRTSAQALEWFLRSLGVAPTEIPRRKATVPVSSVASQTRSGL